MENAAFVLTRLLKKLQVKISATTIGDELQKHPDQSSFAAFSDVLSSIRVPHGAFNLDITTVQGIQGPFIAHLISNNGEFVIVDRMDDRYVYACNEVKGHHRIARVKFESLFEGNVLIVEPDRTIREPEYAKKRRSELISKTRVPLLIAVGIFLLISSLLSKKGLPSPGAVQVALALVKCAGVLVTVVLIMQSMGFNSVVASRLCSFNNNYNCSTILSSRAAHITSYLSWAEVGFFYFSGSFLCYVFNYSNNNVVAVLAIMNLLTLPLPLYSFYYQYRVAKMFCLLCTIIQVLLCAEFLFFLPHLNYPVATLPLNDYRLLFISFASPLLLWSFIRPWLVKAKKADWLAAEYNRFKTSLSLFQARLTSQQRIELPDDALAFVFGDAGADNVITVVSNPYCGPCTHVHQVLDQWLVERNNFKLQLLFITYHDQADVRNKTIRHFHYLRIHESVAVEEAIRYWYNMKNRSYDLLVEKYPVKEVGNIDTPIEQQRNWINSAGVIGTPTVYLNGYRLPEPWQIYDIKYFL